MCLLKYPCQLSIAALAIACRGFSNMVTWSRYVKAWEKVADIRARWKAAERFLGPAIEGLPPLLIIPVVLFIAGLLDTLFSRVLDLSYQPPGIIFTLVFSLLFIISIAALLCITLFHGIRNPTRSPFQTSFTRIVGGSNSVRGRDRAYNYYEVVQETHDDDILDQAAASLFPVICHDSAIRTNNVIYPLSDSQCKTLVHLLSPEASMRSNLSAAYAIIRLIEGYPERRGKYVSWA